MSPFQLWLLALVMWLLCHFWLVPLIKGRWKARDVRGKLKQTGALTILEKVSSLSAVSVVVLSLVIVFVWLFDHLASSGSIASQLILRSAESIHKSIEFISEGYGTALGVIGLVGAGFALYLCARQARQRVATVWMTSTEEWYGRLLNDPKAVEIAMADPELDIYTRRLDQLGTRLRMHDEKMPGEYLTEIQENELRAELNQALILLAQEVACKYLDIEAELNNSQVENAGQLPHRSRWQKIAGLFVSEQLTKDLGLVKKGLALLTTALLVMSLIGWTAEPLANSSRMSVNNLRVNWDNNNAEQELNAAISAVPIPAPLPPPPIAADRAPSLSAHQTAQIVARAAVEAMMQSNSLEHIVGVVPASGGNAEFVRARLGDQLMDNTVDGNISEIRQEVAATVGEKAEKVAVANAEVERIGAGLEPELKRLETEHPDRYNRFVAMVAARYERPYAPIKAQDKLISKMVELAFQPLDVNPAGPLEKEAQKIITDTGAEQFEKWVQSYAKGWLAKALTDMARPDVTALVSSRVTMLTSEESSRFVSSLNAAQGSKWGLPNSQQSEDKMVKSIKIFFLHLLQGEPAEVTARFSERVEGYEQMFPSSLNTDIASLDSPSISPPPIDFSRERAKSFTLASRSFRARGVLIGRDVQSSGLDVDEIRWAIQPATTDHGTTVSIEIRQAGQWRALGVYDAGVVNQALRYASDQRVVATTILAGDGVIIRRSIALHPALLDTPLGCRIVAVDRIVDTFSQKALYSKDQSFATDRAQIGLWLGMNRLTEELAGNEPPKTCDGPEIEAKVSSSGVIPGQYSKAMITPIDQFIAQQEAKRPGSTTLMGMTRACMEGDRKQLGACMCKIQGAGLEANYWFPEDHTSQFRERQFIANNDFKWMQRSPDRLGNIDLWVHTTFAMRHNRKSDETTAVAVDFPSDELDQLRYQVQQHLPAYLKEKLNSPSYDYYMAPVEDFVLLQRMFRLALDGKIGANFPLGRLIDLDNDTHDYVAYQTTVRWEPAENPQSLYDVLTEANPAAAKKFELWWTDYKSRLQNKKPLCAQVSK